MNRMNPSETARVKECVREIAEILYRYPPPEKCQTLDGIEKTIREHWLETVGPEMAFFLSSRRLRPAKEKSESSTVVSGNCAFGENS